MGIAAIGVMTLLELLLSFSRGAWGDYAGSVAASVRPDLSHHAFAAAATSDRDVGSRRALRACVLLTIALSVPAIRDMFFERFSLNQYYDVGETGRFGDQARSVPMLLERMFGFGPLQFARFLTVRTRTKST